MLLVERTDRKKHVYYINALMLNHCLSKVDKNTKIDYLKESNCIIIKITLSLYETILHIYYT